MSDQFRKIFRPYKEMSVRYDRNQEALWGYFKPAQRPCFSPVILKEAKAIMLDIIQYFESGEDRENYPIRYVILASQTPGVFNLGGDLELFIDLIKRRDRDSLLDYATDCIDICHMFFTNLGLPLTTISYVEGSALGGGFESAMSGNVLVAEKHSQMGLPEIRFNLFPGMGAYSFLARKLGVVKAEEMITSGKIYNGIELYDIGVIDVLADSGKGYQAVDDFIRKHRRAANGLRAIQAVRQLYNPVTYKELMNIAQVWVDAALNLEEKDLRTMARLVVAQNRGLMTAEHRPEKIHLVRTRQDRRIDSQNATFPLVDEKGNRISSDRRISYDRRSLDLMNVSN